MAREYFKGKKVEFTDIDVAANQDAARQMVAKTGQMGVPVIEIGEETIIGFDRNRIDLALRENKLI
jgi:glutaredoxin